MADQREAREALAALQAEKEAELLSLRLQYEENIRTLEKCFEDKMMPLQALLAPPKVGELDLSVVRDSGPLLDAGESQVTSKKEAPREDQSPLSPQRTVKKLAHHPSSLSPLSPSTWKRADGRGVSMLIQGGEIAPSPRLAKGRMADLEGIALRSSTTLPSPVEAPGTLASVSTSVITNCKRVLCAGLYRAQDQIQLRQNKPTPKKFKSAFQGSASITYMLEWLNLRSRNLALALGRACMGPYMTCTNVPGAPFADSDELFYDFQVRITLFPRHHWLTSPTVPDDDVSPETRC